MAQFHTLTISSIEKLTNASVAISFEIPENLKANFKFKAGQYITLKANINNTEVRRDYSICTSVNSNTLSVGIKSVENGTFSVYANTKLNIGDTLEVSEPNGRFTFEQNASKTRTIAAFAAGSGITPILSIAKTLLEEEPYSNFILAYGNKTPEDSMFLKDLETLKSTYGNRFHLHSVYSKSRVENTQLGRIDEDIVNLLVKNKYKGITIEAFYLCGPEAMINTVKSTLEANNIKPSAIKYELFTASTSENSESNTDDLTGNTTIKVIVDDEDFEFEMEKSDFILDASLKQNIDAPYSCQGGICSSCIARVTEGTAIMKQNNILTDNEVAEGLILTCQACPTTNSITVDYDDV